MGEIFVYASDCEDFDNIGLCGALTPTSCVFTEEANGISEIQMEHPIDELKKYRDLAVGNIIKCDVPVRTQPVNAENTTLGPKYRYYYVKINTTVANRKLYKSSTGNGILLKTIPATTEKDGVLEDVRLYLNYASSDDRYYVQFTVYEYSKKRNSYEGKFYSGWVLRESVIESAEWYTDYNERFNGIESSVGSWNVKSQLFRISSVNVKNTGVSVRATHIFYDLIGNMVMSGYYGSSCVSECEAAMYTYVLHDFTLRTDINAQRPHGEIRGVNPVSAILDEETGICAWFGGELLRDNYSLYIASNAGYNRGVVIEYGKNLLGVSQTVDMSDMVTAIHPVGREKDGSNLYVITGTQYTTEKYSVRTRNYCVYAADVKDLNGNYLFPDAENIPVPKIVELDKGEDIKAKGKKDAQLLEARNKLIDAAVEEFAANRNFGKAVTIDVNFIALGDTEEYSAYRELESVHLYDEVTIRDTRVGIEATAKVIEVDYNVLTGKMNAVKLGTATAKIGTEKVSQAQLPKINANKLFGTVIADEVQPNGGVEFDGLSFDARTKLDEKSKIVSKNDASAVGSLSENEVFVSSVDTLATGRNILYNGGINGNLSYGLWCPSVDTQSRVVKAYDVIGFPNRYIIWKIERSMKQMTNAPYGVGLHIEYVDGYDGEITEEPITVKNELLAGFRMCEPLCAGRRYNLFLAGKSDTSVQLSAFAGEYYESAIGSLSVNNVEWWQQIGAFTATLEMENATKEYPYITLRGTIGYHHYVDMHSIMLVDVTDIPNFFPNEYEPCKVNEYSNKTTKTKLTYEHGFVVSGYEDNEGTVAEIGTQSSLTPKSVEVSDRQTGESIVSMSSGAKATGNGVAAGGTMTVTIAVTDWVNGQYTASIDGLSADAAVIMSPAPASASVCSAANVRAVGNAAGTVTFACDSTPTDAVTLNLLLLGGVADWSST